MTTFLIPKNIKNKFLIFTMNKIQHYVFFWIKNIVLKNNNIRSDITFSKNGFNPCDFFIFILFVCGIYAVIKIVVDETDSNGIEAYKNFVDSTGIALEIALEEEKKAKEKYEKAIKEEKKLKKNMKKLSKKKKKLKKYLKKLWTFMKTLSV